MGRTAATEMIEARICLPDTLNWSLISAQWDVKGIPAEERVRGVNRLLLRQARFYQDPVLEFLEAREAASVGYVQEFYLTNSIVLKALPHVLHACAALPASGTHRSGGRTTGAYGVFSRSCRKDSFCTGNGKWTEGHSCTADVAIGLYWKKQYALCI